METVKITNFDFLYNENSKYHIQPFDILNIKKYFEQKKGWIYISKNKAFPEIKIGRTSKTPWERAKTLSTSGLLHDYEVLFALSVKNSFIAEKQVHVLLKKHRIKKNKEFFLCNLDIAIKAVEKVYNDEINILKKTFKENFFEENLEFLDYKWINDYYEDLPF